MAIFGIGMVALPSGKWNLDRSIRFKNEAVTVSQSCNTLSGDEEADDKGRRLDVVGRSFSEA